LLVVRMIVTLPRLRALHPALLLLPLMVTMATLPWLMTPHMPLLLLLLLTMTAMMTQSMALHVPLVLQSQTLLLAPALVMTLRRRTALEAVM
jgi:hypothetical protein